MLCAALTFNYGKGRYIHVHLPDDLYLIAKDVE